jgi:hypothetical protein
VGAVGETMEGTIITEKKRISQIDGLPIFDLEMANPL